MSDVFISYSRRDSRAFVERLVVALEQRAKDTWVDLDDIPPASQWRDDLREGVATSDSFCFVISPGSLASEHCARELEYAIERNKRIVPVNHLSVASTDVPDPIASANWIPQLGEFGDDFDASLAALIEAMETDLAWVRGHTLWGQLAEEWERSGHDASLLLRGTKLRDAEEWLGGRLGEDPAPTQLQNDYILASRKAVGRRQRLTLIAVLVALLVSAVLAVVAVIQRNDAVAQRKLAQSQSLVSSANDVRQRDPGTSVALAVEALQVRPTPDALTSLRGSLLALRRGGGAPGLPLIFSPDLRTVVTVANSGSVTLNDAPTGDVISRFPPDVTSVTYSPAGDIVATTNLFGAQLFEARTGRAILVTRAPGVVFDVSFSPDGRRFLTVGDGRATVWDPRTGRPVNQAPSHRRIVDGAFGSDSSKVVLGTRDGVIDVWNLESGHHQLLQNDVPIDAVRFVQDDHSIVSVDSHTSVEIWDLTTGDSEEVP